MFEDYVRSSLTGDPVRDTVLIIKAQLAVLAAFAMKRDPDNAEHLIEVSDVMNETTQAIIDTVIRGAMASRTKEEDR
jgi:hypothetical protein